MKRRIVNVLVATALATGVLFGSLVSGFAIEEEVASVSGSNVISFPWVPNSSVIQDPREDFGDSGPFFGTITIQNLESGRIDLFHTPTKAADFDDFSSWNATKLEPHASMTLNASQLGVSPPGGGVVVAALMEGTTDSQARIAAVQKQASDVAPNMNAETDSDHKTVSGYTGLQEEQIGHEAILPIAQVNANWNSIIRITNFDDAAPADVEVRLNPAQGTGWSVFLTEDVDPGETWSLDLLDTNAPSEWVGSVTIEADVDVAAVVERVKNETNMLIMNVSQYPGSAGGTQSAPLVFDDWNAWNTGISIANLTDSSNDVTVTYYDLDGKVENTEDVVIPADGMNFIYSPASLNGAGGFVGSAVITSDGPIVGSVDEVKYFGDDQDTGHAMSYMVELNAAHIGESLAMPLIQRGSQIDSSGDTSGIQLFNPTEETVTAALWYMNKNGSPYAQSPEIIELEGHEGHTAYTMDDTLMPANFIGSAIIQVLAGDGAIVAASNNVNYSVEHDGSASFNLVRTDSAGPLISEDLVPGLTLTSDPEDETTGQTFNLEAQLTDSFGDDLWLEGVTIEFELDAAAQAHAGLHEIGGAAAPGSIEVETDEFGFAEARVTRDDYDAITDSWMPLSGTVTATIKGTTTDDDVQLTWTLNVL